jgi:hypothetical protein
VNSLVPIREPGVQGPDKLLIGSAFWAAQLVIEMSHEQRADGSLSLEKNQRTQKGHAIGPTGDGDDSALTYHAEQDQLPPNRGQ